MIEVSLNVEGYCVDCPYFSTETSQYKHTVIVSCEYKDRCKRLIEYLESRTTSEKSGYCSDICDRVRR